MTKKKSPEELEQSKREAAERRAFKAGKVAGNGVKTGGKKASKAKASKAKVDAKKASAPKAKPATKQSMKVRVRGSLKGIPLDVEKLEESINDMLEPKGEPAPKDTIAPPTGVHEWRQPRAASAAAHIESTFHRTHLAERAVVEAEAEEALSDARLALSKVHGETTKPPQPRCEIEYRSKVYGEVSRVTQDLDVRLTRDEQLETAESCAHYVASRARMRDLKKSVDSTLGALTKNYDDLVTIYSRAVETGVLSVPVVTIDILEAGEVRTIRADDGRIIKKRQATKEEMQVPIFGESDFGDDSHTEAAE